MIDAALNFSVLHKRPWEEYDHIQCRECGDDVYALNVSHRHPWFEGKTVIMEVWFDVKTRTLVPIYCDVNDGQTKNGDVKH